MKEPTPDEAMALARKLIEQITDPAIRQSCLAQHEELVRRREAAIRALEEKK